MLKTIKIGSASVEPGTKGNGFVNVAYRPDGSEIKIPIMIVNGVNDGPILLVDAGVHGDEYEGMEAIRRVANTLNPKKLKGAFIGIPCLNVLAFEVGKRTNVIDYLNLNRICPGKPVGKGYITENIAYIYEKELVSVLDESIACCISFHGGGNIQKVGPMIPYAESSGSVGEKVSELSKIFGIDLLTTCTGGYPPAGTGGTTSIPLKLNIPAFTVECGDEGRINEEFIKIDIRGLNNIMIYLDMIEGKLDLPEKWIWVEGPLIICKKGGFFLNRITKTGERVSKGDIIGKTINYFGEEVERVEAPDDGIIYLLRTTPSVYPGDWYCGFGVIKKIYKRSDLNL
jgi:predicted deacylase